MSKFLKDKKGYIITAALATGAIVCGFYFYRKRVHHSSLINVHSTETQYIPVDISSIYKENNFDKEDVNKIHYVFKKLYPSSKGLGKDVFEQICTSLKIANKDIINRLFKLWDKDKDNFIGFKELVECLTLLKDGNEDDQLKFYFELCDIDGNGKIDRRELESIFETFTTGLDEQEIKDQVKSIIEKSDQNNDKYISLDEFIKHCKDTNAKDILNATGGINKTLLELFLKPEDYNSAN